jgi:RNase H-like domain found in reverse transcriptase
MQEQRSIAFLSKKLGVRNQSLSTYEKELLALYTVVTKWRHYLLGTKFVIKTDQISLKYLLKQRINTPMQHRGLSKLLGLNYRIEYKNEVDNKVVEALSRMVYSINEIDHELQVVSEIISQWVTDIQKSYIGDS